LFFWARRLVSPEEKKMAPGKNNRISRRTGLAVVSVVVVVGIWLVLTSVTRVIPPAFLPPPQNIVTDFFRILGNPYVGNTLVGHTLVSLQIVLGGFFSALLIGIPLGILMGWFKRIEAVVDPLFQLLRPIPPLAWIPISLLWFGIGMQSKIFVIWLSAFVPCVINSYTGIRLTEPLLVKAALGLGVKRQRDLLREVAIPSALPIILGGARIGLGSAWMTLVAAELLASDAGLGYMMQMARRALEPSVIILGMLVIGILGALMARGLRALEKRVCPWVKEEEH
jgi:ABC-type nitrate/sulfonate/bicarbonate transport system permease component